MTAYYLIDTNENHCSSHDSSICGMLMVSIFAASTTFAVTDNSTDVSTRGGANDSSSVVAGNGSSDRGESAKSGINTTVRSPDAAHACQTPSILSPPGYSLGSIRSGWA